MDGYHIEVRDWSASELQFDTVDISGGATRSHTLSDLRPNTRYSIFILPHAKQGGLTFRGRPSNMKNARTKEDGNYFLGQKSLLKLKFYFHKRRQKSTVKLLPIKN